MYSDEKTMTRWIEAYGKYYRYMLDRGETSHDSPKARWLADLWARQQLCYQFPDLKPEWLNEIQIMFEKVLFFGVSVKGAFMVPMEFLIDARNLALKIRNDTNQVSEYDPYGEEIIAALKILGEMRKGANGRVVAEVVNVGQD